MNIRKLSLAIVTVAALAPVVASASPEDAALNACAKAFAASIAAPGTTPAYKVSYAHNIASPVTDYYARTYTFTMKAQNAKSGNSFASATCSADTKGEVLTLTASTPNEAITLASR